MSALPPLRRSDAAPSLPVRTAGAETVSEIRRRFLSGGVGEPTSVAKPILRSWQRCAALGLATDRAPRIEPLTRHELRERLDRVEVLRRAARPEIEALNDDARATRGIVVLTDSEGCILDACGSTEFAEKAARVALRPGATWIEAATGTNAIGTALAERREITVLGGEHWYDANRFLSCSAVPIFDMYGAVAGVIDLSHHASVQQTHAPALLRRAVAVVERRLFDVAAEACEVVRFHSDPAELGSIREGWCAFDGDRLVGANRQALALLDRGWDVVGNVRFADLFAGSPARIARGGRIDTVNGRSVFTAVSETPRRIAGARLPNEGEPDRRNRSDDATPASALRDAPFLDAAVRAAMARAIRLVDADVPVLVQGETGAGKEVFARALHAGSSRADRPFVAVNCAALPETLIEAELFGYEEGAFTGARKAGSKGLLREAEGGVLFLDEIGDMPLALQARLLRALQERVVTPLGGGRPVPVEFALVCATHRELSAMVEAGAFRQDLYFRIAQYTVELDPLRGRRDLPEIVATLWRRLGAEERGVSLSAEAIEALVTYEWPGNWRQLAATLRTLIVLAEPGEELAPDALPADVRRRRRAVSASTGTIRATVPDEGSPQRADTVAAPSADLARITRDAISAALAESDGNVTRAARRLGVHRSTLHRHLADRARTGA